MEHLDILPFRLLHDLPLHDPVDVTFPHKLPMIFAFLAARQMAHLRLVKRRQRHLPWPSLAPAQGTRALL